MTTAEQRPTRPSTLDQYAVVSDVPPGPKEVEFIRAGRLEPDLYHADVSLTGRIDSLEDRMAAMLFEMGTRR